MDLTRWLDLFKEEALRTDLPQWIILFCGVAEVMLAKANNILLYPAGIVATVLSAMVLFNTQLFAESLLNVYYVVMSIYGWWFWLKKKHEPTVKIGRASESEWKVTALIVFGGWVFLFFVLKTFTTSNVPAWDAWISSTAWAGMWLLARRKIENWILLNISNAFAIPLLFQKGLPMFSLLTIFLFVVACFGYVDWKRRLKRDQMAITAT